MNRTANPVEPLHAALHNAQDHQRLIPFVGMDDMSSASPSAERLDALLLSGFDLAARTYGQSNIGFIDWEELTSTTSHQRELLPCLPLLIEMDDGIREAAAAGCVTRALERCGASEIVLEDQATPRAVGTAMANGCFLSPMIWPSCKQCCRLALRCGLQPATTPPIRA
ncbi:MAG: hypothetical protein ACK5GZ_06315 [Cyanobium sp.]|jgi:2-methylisocitrate lyase-like PEP mutase family enzyme